MRSILLSYMSNEIRFKSFEEFKKFLEKKDLEIKNKAAKEDKKNEIRKD
jgi:hypothetical protein